MAAGWARKAALIAVWLAASACVAPAPAPVVPEEPPAKARDFAVTREGAERATAYALAAPPGHARVVSLMLPPERAEPPHARWIMIGHGTVRERSKGESCSTDFCLTVDTLLGLTMYDFRPPEQGGAERPVVRRFAGRAELEAWLAANPILSTSSSAKRRTPIFAEIAPSQSAVKEGHSWEWVVVDASSVAVDDATLCGWIPSGSDARCARLADIRSLTLVGPAAPGKSFAASRAGVEALLAEAAAGGVYVRVGFERRTRGTAREPVMLRTVSELTAARICGLVARMPHAGETRCFDMGEIALIQVEDHAIADDGFWPDKGPGFGHYRGNKMDRIEGGPFRVTGSASGIKPLRPGGVIGDLGASSPVMAYGDGFTPNRDDCPFCYH